MYVNVCMGVYEYSFMWVLELRDFPNVRQESENTDGLKSTKRERERERDRIFAVAHKMVFLIFSVSNSSDPPFSYLFYILVSLAL